LNSRAEANPVPYNALHDPRVARPDRAAPTSVPASARCDCYATSCILFA
jgi:hypothetical protein